MSNILTYPALRCVLEYMEANKRIHTAFRCPSLQTFEKSIPLRLDILRISEDFLDLNRMHYDITSAVEQIVEEDDVDCGDLVTMPLLHRENTFYTINFECGNRTQIRRAPDGIDMRTAIRKLIEIMLGGRKTIIVNWLLNNSYKVLRLPVGLAKFRVNKLYSACADHRHLLSLIDDSSFPLKSLQTTLTSSETAKHTSALTAKELIISRQRDVDENVHLGYILNLSHKNVIINDYETPPIFEFINAWITREQEIGTRYRFECEDRESVEDYHMFLEDQFKRQGAEHRLIGNMQILTIPINATSEIVFRGVLRNIPIRKQDDEIVPYLEMEVIPFQSVAITKKETGVALTTLFANFPISILSALLLMLIIGASVILCFVATQNSREL